MRWHGLLVLGVLLSACHGEDQATGNSSGALRTSPLAVNFGPTALGSSSVVELHLTNGGRAPFQVNALSTAVPNVDVEKFAAFVLLAGQERVLHLRFTPTGEGPMSGSVVVTTDQDPDHPDTELAISGLGVNPVATVAEHALDFGSLAIGSHKELSLTLRNPTQVDATVQVTLSGSDSDEFSSTADASIPLSAGEVRAVTVSFSPQRLGVGQAQVVVKPCAQCAPIQVPLTGTGIAAQLDVSPQVVDFGSVAVGALAQQDVSLRNLGTTPVTFDGVKILGDTQQVLAATATGATSSLAPGQSVTITVTYRPTQTVALSGTLLEIAAYPQGSAATAIKLPIVATAGSGCVTLSPRRLDFGIVPEGSRAHSAIAVYNRCSTEVMVGTPTLTVQKGGYFLLDNPTGFTVPAGTNASIGVVFTPKTGAGTAEASLDVQMQTAATTVHESVALTGEGRAFAPCTFAVEPPMLDFGTTAVGSRTTLAVGIRNTGTDDCFVSSMGLAAGSDASFVADPQGSSLLHPGDRAVLPVTFAPAQAGQAGGLAEAWVSNPTTGHVTVPLSANAADRCISVAPATLDFGLRSPTCGEKTMAARVSNACSYPVTLASATIDPGMGFSLVNPPAFPMTLAAGGQVSFTVAEDPPAQGTMNAALRIDAGNDGTLTVGLLATTRDPALQTDVFTQDVAPKVDVLFVIDNSGSMSEEQSALSRNLAAFLSAARNDGVDYHLGVTTTGIKPSPSSWSACGGGAEGGEAGRLFPADGSSPRILTPQTQDPETAFAEMVTVGTCHWLEQGLEAAYLGLSSPLVDSADDPATPLVNDGNLGFLRPDAKLALVFISDEDDQSDRPVDFYGQFFHGLKSGAADVTVSAIVGPENLAQNCPTASGTGTRYMELVKEFGGVSENICTPDWTQSLQSISAASFSGRRRFELSSVPADPTQVTVTVDGNTWSTGWSYDPASNEVVFDATAVPPAGSVIAVTYPLGC